MWRFDRQRHLCSLRSLKFPGDFQRSLEEKKQGACTKRDYQFARFAEGIQFVSTTSSFSGAKFVGQGLLEQDVYMAGRRADVRIVEEVACANTEGFAQGAVFVTPKTNE